MTRRLCFLLAVAVVLARAAERQTILAIFSHPDDETAIGPLLARYAAEGHAVHLITITSGQKGATPHVGIPAGDQLGAAREDELRCAAARLGIQEPILLRFQDQGISDPPTLETVATRIREKINELKPDVIVTWGPDGLSGHPDHRATSSITTEIFQQRSRLQHRPKKLYYVAWPESLFLKPEPPFDRRPLRTVSDELVTTVVDGSKYLKPAGEAIGCHKTQWRPEQMEQMRALGERLLQGKVYLRLVFPERAAPLKEPHILAR